MKKNCNTCGLLDPRKNICQLFGHNIDPAADFCSRYHNQVTVCDYCGKITLSPLLDINEDKSVKRIYCAECAKKIGTCVTCNSINTCAFETDSSAPTPKFIQQPIRQGNMVITTNVMNPDRIANTCQKGCHCWSDENGCMRQNNVCGNYAE
jgi:hypothetical protein